MKTSRGGNRREYSREKTDLSWGNNGVFFEINSTKRICYLGRVDRNSKNFVWGPIILESCRRKFTSVIKLSAETI
jgi:hypothetical protein